ncbi:hypothetical protein, partial [Mesotoga sp. TolDC]|uniref:hypothetical protein n=1 Tax=Mesotoga sp. TolDC TaxID=1389250 RepID=UPI001C646B6E
GFAWPVSPTAMPVPAVPGHKISWMLAVINLDLSTYDCSSKRSATSEKWILDARSRTEALPQL